MDCRRQRRAVGGGRSDYREIGLSKWKQELKGKTDFDAARHLITATYKLRDQVQICRSPFYSAHEFPEDYKGGRGDHSSEEETRAWLHIYRNRWEPVWAALQEFDARTLEAEALWGQTVRARTDALRLCVKELNVAIDAVVADKAVRGENFKSDREFGRQMRSVVAASRDDQSNDLNQKLAKAITGIEDEVRPHLRRGRIPGGSMKGEKREQADETGKNEEDDGSDGFKAYLEYNRVLRTWFVAFGIGGPALFIVNETIGQKLVSAGQLRLVVSLFLLGAAVQVLGALLNKIANWYVYIGTIDADVKGSRRQRFADWLISQFWIDITIDVISICSFGAAAWFLLTVFTKAS
jgi:hypothetical protein